jgi:CRP/FNR family cyclic AMP-dependent transcriptional regulator
MTSLARAALSGIHLFRYLDADGLERVANVAVRHSYKEGTYIFSTGNPGDAMFGLISGQVLITANNLSHQEIFLDVINPNEVFGVSSVVDGLPRWVNAKAATSVEAFRICRANFMQLILTDRNLSLGLIDVLCSQQRLATQMIIDEYSQSNISARLAHRVLDLMAIEGACPSDCPCLTITQAELAKFVFVSRQVVNQHLSDWQERGWISASRRRLVINDRHALSELARSGSNGSDRDA